MCLGAHLLAAQTHIMRQDSSLNNLVLPAGYVTEPLGTLGNVVRQGTGPIDVVIIPGWGFSVQDFEPFMRDNATRYHMVAVTLPGFAGTPAPPMPPAGTSYSEHTWTHAAEDAIVNVIRDDHLRKPILLGHFIVGTQLALQLALDHPDVVGGIVIIGGEPMRYTPSRRDPTGKTPMSKEERVAGIDAIMGPRWFKTVTLETWNSNNFVPGFYSRDSAQAARLWQQSADVPMPIMIRYLCEYWSMDLDNEWSKLDVPATVLIPDIAPEVLADPAQAALKGTFVDAWTRVASLNPHVTLRSAPGSRIFVTVDRPDLVRAAIDSTARRAH